MMDISAKVQVNIPFTMLWDTYFDAFMRQGLNPEIGIDAAALDRFSRGEFGRMAEQLLERGLEITLHGPFFDLSPGSIDSGIQAATRHRFEQLLDLVPLFKPKTVVCHAGYDWRRYGYAGSDWVRNSIDTWRWLGDGIKAAGSRLMLENVYETGPEEMRTMFEHLTQQQVGLCLDTGHQSAFGKASLNTWVESLAVYLGQLHLHDNFGQKDDHLALGEGEIDFKVLFARLKTLMPRPPVITLEPHRKDALAPSLAYLEKIWPWGEGNE
jgi:sugar phosphate isomerase/epimerase